MANSSLYVSKSSDYKYQKGKKGTYSKVPKKNKKTTSNAIQAMLKPEKKHKNVSGQSLTVGQCNINASAYGAYDITPLCSSSTTYGGRTGSKIVLTSSFIQMQFSDQTNRNSPIRGAIYIFKTMEPQSSPGSFVANMFNYNPFAGGGFSIIDYNSNYNIDQLHNWKLIRKRNFVHKPDSVANQVGVSSLTIPLKYNKGKGHLVQYDKDSNTLIEGQILMVILLDNGNVNASSPSTLSNIPNLGVSSGLKLDYNLEHYYYDN